MLVGVKEKVDEGNEDALGEPRRVVIVDMRLKIGVRPLPPFLSYSMSILTRTRILQHSS